jgi:hypothetical protein
MGAGVIAAVDHDRAVSETGHYWDEDVDRANRHMQ